LTEYLPSLTIPAMMKRLATLCMLLLGATPAPAAPLCEDVLARLETADKRSFVVERYGSGGYLQETERGPVAYYVHAWQGNENGALRVLTFTEIPGTSGPNWGSLGDPKELKAKFEWRNLDSAELEDAIRVTGGPLEGEWTLACQGRPPIKVNFPRFADYPATGRPYRGRVKRPVVSRRVDETVRLRLTDAFRPDERPNFAARYVRLTWSCGTACVGGALLDAPTGRVIWLPHMSDWTDVPDDFEAFAVRPNSRLLVLSGARNERGIIGRHFYVMRNGRLRHLRSVETERSFPQKVE
jgi:hypothetical protein